MYSHGRDRQSPARSLGEIAGKLLRRKRFFEKGKYGPLAEAWQELVGEGIAARTKIRSFTGGKLVVEVGSSSLLHELNGFLKDSLLEGLRGVKAGRDVAGIEFRLGSPPADQDGRHPTQADGL